MARDGGKYRLLRLEALEPRTLLDGAPVTNVILYHPDQGSGAEGSTVTPGANTPAGCGFTPAQIRAAYGINSIEIGSVVGNGRGQTIAIIDEYNQPNIVSDVAAFNSQFGLQKFNVAGGPTLQVLNQTGGTSLPGNAPSDSNWGIEISLDVEWAHAIAPEANIILFEAKTTGIFTAVSTARSWSGVSVVSMSWTSTDSSSDHSYDTTYFTTPSGHANITFLAATGDTGVPGGYPAFSPNVIAVGGTTLTLNANGTWASEVGWNDSGGGKSQYESQPSYQDSVQTSGDREIPDVSFDANPGSGVAVYDSYDDPGSSWIQTGGTSLACPCWAGLIAIADQFRAIEQVPLLTAPTALATLYGLSNPYTGGYFHDITSGNNGDAAGPGYDMVTGIGTPIANVLIPALAPPQPDMVVDIGDSGGGAVSAGDVGDSYFLTVSNSGLAASSGTLTLTANVSTGLTIMAASGSGWTVTGLTAGSATATRSDALAAGASYSDLTLTVNVASGAPGFVSTTAVVSGGGEGNTANDYACDGDLVNSEQDVIVSSDDSGVGAATGGTSQPADTPALGAPETPSSGAAARPTALPAAESSAKEAVLQPVWAPESPVAALPAAPLLAAAGPSLAAIEGWATPRADSGGSEVARTAVEIRAHDAVLQSRPAGSSAWEAMPVSGPAHGRGRRDPAGRPAATEELVVVALAGLLS